MCKKSLNINTLIIKIIVKLERCHYTGKQRGAAHSICNLKYGIPKEIPVDFLNWSNYDYHFIINELAKDFEEFNCLGENTDKHKPFSIPIRNEVKKIDKMGKKLQKPYLTNYNLLIAQDLWQAHYQILLINLLKEFIKLTENMDMITKNAKNIELRSQSNNENFKNNFLLDHGVAVRLKWRRNVFL